MDDGSPAEAAGLREGDKIIEVNGENISTSNHQGVVARIKENPNETRLLVMDAETLAHYDSKGLTVTSSSPEVDTITCPDRTGKVIGHPNIIGVTKRVTGHVTRLIVVLALCCCCVTIT